MTATPDTIDPYVPERGNPGYEVSAYDLELRYAIASNHLEGRARLMAVATEPLPRFALDLVGLRTSKVTVGGQPARWEQRRGKLHVTPAGPVEAGAGVAIDVRYSGNPRPTASPWGPLGWEELADGVLVAAQPSGACTWFPCNDLARQKAAFRVAVTAATTHRVVANGELVSRRAGGSTTTWVYEQDEPTSPYLATLNIGRYDEHEVAGGPVRIRGVVPPRHRRAFDAAFGRLAEMMDVFVELFGPYPFRAGYTVVVTPEPLEVPLEAQGQAIFGTNHLDATWERLIAHELAHQWWGNSVTAARWQDVWLHEGFACYAEWLWSEASGGRPADEHARNHHRRLVALPQDLVLGDPGPVSMFDDRVYKRGALTLHALRLEVGERTFADLLRSWASTHAHGVVSTDDFRAAAEAAAGRSLASLFDAWLGQARLPRLTAPS